jgi:two-component system, OmpR family, sensor histidine kinase KdpD
LLKRALRIAGSLGGVAAVTVAAHRLFQGGAINATTIGFAYLLLVLAIASTWGFVEAAAASVAATLTFNYFFLPPVATLTIADPQNWIALFSFLGSSLIASRLSAKAERRAQDANARRQDVEHLYSFSRAILLIDSAEPFPKQLVRKLADIFPVTAAALYDRRTGDIFRAGPSDLNGLEDHLKDAARHGSSFSDPERNRVITAVRLGSEPIAALALEGPPMPDSVLQGIANLVAIGLERARAQDLASQIEAARRSEQLRTTLLDAMTHEFKTPLTSIKAATTALLASPDEAPESRAELLAIADEEADRLSAIIDDAVEMARLDTAHIDLHPEASDIADIVRTAAGALPAEIEDRRIELACDSGLPQIALDRRLIGLALKQLLDNALKYSPPATPVAVRIRASDGSIVVEVANSGDGISPQELDRIFERFYRAPSARLRAPGSGLGLSIAQSIVQAHGGALTVVSGPGETTFRMTLPMEQKGARL